VLAAVERHVFEEMSEPVLIVFLVKRAGLDEQPQRGAALGFFVRTHRVAQAVGERAEMHGGVGLEIAALLGKRNRCAQRDNQGKPQRRVGKFPHDLSNGAEHLRGNSIKISET
jgi:hypothetical protein